ncbi:carbohydrate binding domain-containing protein [Elusimicrobiota bacterium]
MKRFAGLYLLITAFSVSSLQGSVIDKMNSAWNTVTDSTATLKVSVTDNSNKMKYDLNDDSEGEWVEIYTEDLGKPNISDGDSISFYLKGSGAKNDFKLQLYDTDGDISDRELSESTDISEWKKVIIPFSSLNQWDNTGDGTFDKDKIDKIAFSVSAVEGKSGSIAIDRICTYQLNTGESFLISSFDYGTPPNEMGGNEGPVSPDDNLDGDGDYDPDVIYSRDSYEGLYSLGLEYDFPVGKWCGYWINLDPDEDKAADISDYTHLKFLVKSDEAGKKIKIEIEDKDRITITELTDHLPGGTSTSWQEVKIPLTAFAPAVVSTAAKQVKFIFHEAPRSGTVYIDHVRFITHGRYTGGSIAEIDNMDTNYKISGWENYGIYEDNGITATKLESIDGKEGAAVRLNYSFNRKNVNSNDWVVMERDWGLNITSHDSLKFDYRGTGPKNNLEVKISDKNGTRFWRKFFKVTNTDNSWQSMVIPLKEFSFFIAGSGGEEELDLRNINAVYFTVSRNEGGAGTVYIKNLQSISEEGYQARRSGKVIERLDVLNNPFSPNGDGIEDNISFILRLSQKADIVFRVFNMAGEEVYKRRVAEMETGMEHIIDWDGYDKSDDLVKNGLYFYQITAESSDKNDSITHVIAVLR